MTIGDVLKHVDSGVEVEVCKDYWTDTVVQTKEYLSNKWHDEFDEIPVHDVRFSKTSVTIDFVTE